MRKKRSLPTCVYLNRHGKYVAKVRINGKLSESAAFADLADAIDYVDAVRRNAVATVVPKPKGLTLGEWIDDWIKKRAAAGQWRDVENDKKVLARYVEGDMRDRILRDLRQRDVRGWLYELSHRQARHWNGALKGKTISRRTMANALNLLRVSLEDAVSAGKMTSNPALGLRPPKRGEATTVEHTGYVPMDKLDALFGMSGPPMIHRAFWIVALYTGMRVGEVCGLRWENVILGGDNPELIVRFSRNAPTKGGRVRRVPLLAAARDALAEVRASLKVAPMAGLVFPSRIHRGGAPQPHATGFDADWREWAPKAGIDLPIKQLRHSCGCHLVQGTWGPPATMEEVQRWLGHASVTTTERFYARFKPGALHSLRASLDSSPGSSPGGKRTSVKKTNRPTK